MPRLIYEKENRAKTNSITHLVQIVAREEAEKIVTGKLRQHCEDKHRFPHSLEDMLAGVVVEPMTPKTFIKDKSGMSWELDDDIKLQQEYGDWLAWVAQQLGRSYTSIQSRMRQKGGRY